MALVAGIRFKSAGKIYYFECEEFDLQIGDQVIVETVRGVELGNVALKRREVPNEELVLPLKKVIRLVTDADIKKHEANKEREKKAFDICKQKIKEHQLDMHLIEVEYTFDLGKVIFYFTSDNRVDFRELVKDLAAIFKTRIELRQVGVRDEAKMLGGIGTCGHELCCKRFLGEFAPVSIRMAKEQNLSLNPAKISGVCSRLMCCLRYESEIYLDEESNGKEADPRDRREKAERIDPDYS